jgi:hypothetical protein
MTDWLLGLLVACLLSTALLVAPAVGAQTPAATEESLAGAAVAELEEASAEAAEAATEAAEVTAAQAEDAAFSHLSPLSSKAAEEYPALYGRIAKINAIIAKLQAEKQALRELPLHSKRRKAFLPRKHERIMEERQRIKDVHKKIRAKKEAARA